MHSFREYDVSPYASSPYADLPQSFCHSQFGLSIRHARLISLAGLG